jgi:hypothetical protein
MPFKCVFKSVAFAAVLACTSASQLARAAVEVSAFRIEEARTIEFGDDKVSRTQPMMKILLFLRGPEAESSIRYGELKLEEAVDDLGSSLLPSKELWNDAAKFKDYENSFFRSSSFGGNGQRAAPEIELSLTLPKRAATKINRLRGSLTICDQGAIHEVALTNLKEPGKKTLAIPESSNISITIDVPTGEKVHSIGIEITGDESIPESVEVIDGSGHNVSSGISSWNINGGPAHKSIELSKPLDVTMKLVAKFALGRKRTVVRFDLKDIPLP